MNNNVKISLLFLCSFSCATQCMEIEQVQQGADEVGNVTLQKLINSVNKSSLNMVNFVKERAQDNGIPLVPHNVKQMLKLDQGQIDQIFLSHVDDDNLRSLAFAMGANIKARDIRGKNCLFFTGKSGVLKDLIDRGAEVNAADQEGRAPLFQVLSFSQEKEQAAHVLLENKASPDAADPVFGSVLHRMVEDHDLVMVQLLCGYKVNPNVKNSFNRTPLRRAVELGADEIVRVLLEHGALADTMNEYGRYLLHTAMPEDQIQNIIPAIVILLLQYGADPNRPYPYSHTRPIEIAVKMNDLAVVKAFLVAGAGRYSLSRSKGTYKQFLCYFQCSPDIAALFCEDNPGK